MTKAKIYIQYKITKHAFNFVEIPIQKKNIYIFKTYNEITNNY